MNEEGGEICQLVLRNVVNLPQLGWISISFDARGRTSPNPHHLPHTAQWATYSDYDYSGCSSPKSSCIFQHHPHLHICIPRYKLINQPSRFLAIFIAACELFDAEWVANGIFAYFFFFLFGIFCVVVSYDWLPLQFSCLNALSIGWGRCTAEKWAESGGKICKLTEFFTYIRYFHKNKKECGTCRTATW